MGIVPRWTCADIPHFNRSTLLYSTLLLFNLLFSSSFSLISQRTTFIPTWPTKRLFKPWLFLFFSSDLHRRFGATSAISLHRHRELTHASFVQGTFSNIGRNDPYRVTSHMFNIYDLVPCESEPNPSKHRGTAVYWPQVMQHQVYVSGKESDVLCPLHWHNFRQPVK